MAAGLGRPTGCEGPAWPQGAGKRGFSTHYVNLGRTAPRIRRLLRDFRFAPIRDVVGLGGVAGLQAAAAQRS